MLLICCVVWMTVMPLLAISHWRHSFYRFSLHIHQFVIIFVSTISYKPVAGISPNLQFCTNMNQLHFEVKRSLRDQMHFSSGRIPIGGLLLTTIWFVV